MTEKLETISDLENKNRKLADEKRKVETSLEFLITKFKVLHESVARLEDDSKLLVSLAASGRGNNDGEPLLLNLWSLILKMKTKRLH